MRNRNEELKAYLKEIILPIDGVKKILWGEDLTETPALWTCLLKKDRFLFFLKKIPRYIHIAVEEGKFWEAKNKIYEIAGPTELLHGAPYQIYENDFSLNHLNQLI